MRGQGNHVCWVKGNFWPKLSSFFQFTNCSCLPQTANGSVSVATSGKCVGESCSTVTLVLYLATLFVSIILIFGVAIPGLQATIRIVIFSQRSFAVGVQVGRISLEFPWLDPDWGVLMQWGLKCPVTFWCTSKLLAYFVTYPVDAQI